jgi:hypothetical protein
LKNTILLLFFLFCYNTIFPQKSWQISVPYGISIKTTPIYFKGNGNYYSSIFVPFNPEWNTQVLSGNIGITLTNSKTNLALEYYPNLRYNYIHSRFDNTGSTKRELGVYNFLIDHQFKIIFHPYSFKFKRKFYSTAGFGINNFGKKVFVPKFQRDIKLSYLTMNLGGGVHFNKISNLEYIINIIPKTLPTNRSINLITLELQYKRMFYFGKKMRRI